MSFDFNKEKLLLAGNLTPTLIHDLRNSLAVLKLNNYYLKLKEDSLPEEIASSLKDWAEAITRIEKKLDYFSLLTSNNLAGELCSLNAVITSAIDSIKGKAKKNNTIIEDKSESDLPSLKINKTKISFLILSLINFLIDASFDKQKIYLKAYKNNSKEIALEIKRIVSENVLEDSAGNSMHQYANERFLIQLKELKEFFRDDSIRIKVEDKIQPNCKIVLSFIK